jgi:hypothetical protein
VLLQYPESVLGVVRFEKDYAAVEISRTDIKAAEEN